MRRHLIRYVLAGLIGLAGLPAAALAQTQAFTNTTANLRAGPASDYPAVAQLAGGTPVAVMGCVSGYSWCDVALPNLRGWVYAGSLSYPYQGSNVPILGYGTAIGLPIVTFSLGTYWDSYYRGRPWYRDRDRWSHHRPPPSRPRPPGGYPGHSGRPPGGSWHPPGNQPPGGGWHNGGRPGGGHSGPGAGGRPPGGHPPGGGRPPGGGGWSPGGGGHPPGGGGRPPGGGGRPSGGGGHSSGGGHSGGGHPPGH